MFGSAISANPYTHFFRKPIRSIKELAKRFTNKQPEIPFSSSSIYSKEQMENEISEQNTDTEGISKYFSLNINSFQSSHLLVDKSNITQIYNDVSLMEPEAIFKLGFSRVYSGKNVSSL